MILVGATQWKQVGESKMKEEVVTAIGELPPEVLTDLKGKIRNVWLEGRQQVVVAPSTAERRALAQATLKRVTREVFLTQPTATEADFERCWPRLRDQMFVDYTQDLAVKLIRMFSPENV